MSQVRILQTHTRILCFQTLKMYTIVGFFLAWIGIESIQFRQQRSKWPEGGTIIAWGGLVLYVGICKGRASVFLTFYLDLSSPA